LDGIDGMILPGGESSTMLKLLHYETCLTIWRNLAGANRCSGLAPAHSDGQGRYPSGAGKPGADGHRGADAYGRQADSRVVELDPEPEFEKRTAPGKLEAVFIRAPIIRSAGTESGAGG
jgi:5'-phosphate synthase pdxT subunit